MEAERQKVFIMTDEQYDKIKKISDILGMDISDYIYKRIEELLQEANIQIG